MWGRREMHTGFLWENLKEASYYENLERKREM
jgi:hypothetical protein